MPQIRLDSVQEMATAIAELYERVEHIEQRSVNLVRGSLKAIRVGRALVDGRAPFVTEDVYQPFVISGLETSTAGNGVSVDVAPGSAYNVERYRQAGTANLAVTNTGIAHTEYVSVTSEGRLVIEVNVRPAGYLAIADASVDALGNVDQVVDRRKLDLQTDKVFTVDDVVWANTEAPGAPSGLQAFVSFHNTELYWTNPSDNDFSHVKVYRADNVNDRAQASFIAEATGTRFVDGPLGYGDTVYYWIRAVDRAGNVGPWHPADQFSGVVATLKQVQAPDIQDGAVVEAKLDDWAVSTRTIAQQAVNDSKVADVSVVKLISGTVTTLELNVVDESFLISSGQQAVVIKDKQAVPVTRVFIGKQGVGIQDYGITVRDPSGNIVLQTTGGGTFIDGAFINSLTASKISAGTFSADYVLAGSLLTSVAFPHVGIDSNGIVGRDGAGTMQFRVRTADGKAEFAGGDAVLDDNGIILKGARKLIEFQPSPGGDWSWIYVWDDEFLHLETPEVDIHGDVYFDGLDFLTYAILDYARIGPESDASGYLYFRTKNRAGTVNVDHKLTPMDPNQGYLGDSAKYWYRCYVNYGYFLDVLPKNGPDTGSVGNPTDYFFNGYFDHLRYKDLGSFQDHDDVGMIRQLRRHPLRPAIDPASAPAEIRGTLDMAEVEGRKAEVLRDAQNSADRILAEAEAEPSLRDRERLGIRITPEERAERRTRAKAEADAVLTAAQEEIAELEARADPGYDLGACIGLCFGAIRQLADRLDSLELLFPGRPGA